MKIIKTSQEPQAVLQPGHLEDINRLSRTPLTEAEVYAFSVRLCDNEVDRDGERFAPRTLEQLAPLFVGKSGIFDHNWSAQGQAARLYRTEVVAEPGRLTQAGDPYCWLKGYAYMVRTPDNQSLIAEIEGGIKKEVSVACSVEKAVCSICGAPRGENCGHKPGEVYDGKLCCISLEEARMRPGAGDAGARGGAGQEVDLLPPRRRGAAGRTGRPQAGSEGAESHHRKAGGGGASGAEAGL